jgi:hypothetical protein
MKLDNLIGEVESLADKNAELRKRKLEMQDEYVSLCESNFEKIVLPYVEKMNNVLETISNKSKVGIDQTTPIRLYDDNDFFFDLEASSYAIHLHYYEYETYGTRIELNINNQYKSLDYFQWKRICDWFLTEEKAYAFVEMLSEKYCEILGKYRVGIAKHNEQLAAAIQKLEDTLKGASAPKENVDGTVEFHINGKTYVGTVKEE